MTRAFTTNTNDQLLVVYLSALVRAVIALEKLVDNKATNGVAELEEGTSAAAKKGKDGKKAITNGSTKDEKATPETDKTAKK